MPAPWQLLAAGLALAGTAAAFPVVHATGPPPGHTGGFGEPTCAVCHIGNDLNAFGGSVRLEGLPDAYESGAAYVLSVILRADETAIAGFQMAARFSGGDDRGASAGSFLPLDARVRVLEAAGGARYVHQTVAGSSVSTAEGSSWAVEWIAPDSEVPVEFHLTATSGNGDNSPLSDLVYTFAAEIPSVEAGAQAVDPNLQVGLELVDERR